jgi:hypothetical protein
LAAQQAPGRQQKPAPQIPRDGWKDCSYNDVTIGCKDQQIPGGLRIVWKDGLSMIYHDQPSAGPGQAASLRDLRGGIWRRQVLAQGNTVLTNERTGARIFVPLRFPCRPPLKGEVGYCHY